MKLDNYMLPLMDSNTSYCQMFISPSPLTPLKTKCKEETEYSEVDMTNHNCVGHVYVIGPHISP